MRFLAVLAPAAGVLIVLYLLARGPQPEPPSQVSARVAVDSVARARLDAFAEGRFEDWARALRRGGLILAADPAKVLTDSAAAVAEMRRDFDPLFARGLKLDITPRRWVVGATRRGRLAWVGAELDDGVATRGDRTAQPLRQTSAYLLRGRQWTLMLDNYSRGPTWDELREGARAGVYPRPAALAAPVEGGDERSVEKRFKRWIGDLTRVRLDRGVVLVGPAAGDLVAGDSAARVLLRGWKERLGALRLLDDGVRVWVSDGVGAGWVAATVEASPPEWGGTKLPLRVTSVWRSTGEDSWRLVVAHVSIGVSDQESGATAAAGR